MLCFNFISVHHMLCFTYTLMLYRKVADPACLMMH